MKNLDDVRKEILSDGKVDEEDVNTLKHLMQEEGRINHDLANFLFDIKNTVSPTKLSPEFKSFFVEALSNHLLFDEKSPGEIDENEARWLRGKIQAKGNADEYDKALLEDLKNRSINFPKVLHYKSLQARQFERLLYSSRYLSLIAVIGSLVSSVILFIQGIVIIFKGLVEYFMNPTEKYEVLFEKLVSSVDVFLFALALIIFGVGIYELFVTKIDPVEKNVDSRPSWLQTPTLDDLKSSLGKVILMVLIVSFFKHVLEISNEMWDPKALLYLAIGILLIAGALYLTHKPGHEKKK
ncbi:MAG: YqhA family protein [Muribaculaceae bacterium]|nr:YqhA family protein [Muribaculaceae bacterium]